MSGLFLPGGNPETMSLMHDIATDLALSEGDCYFQKYRFWQTGQAPDVAGELAQLSVNEVDWVIAKSAGTLLFFCAVIQRRLSYRRAVLLGTPLTLLAPFGLTLTDLQSLPLGNCLFVSQQQDRVCPSAALQELGDINLLAIDGNDHLYLQRELYRSAMAKFLTSENT